MSKSIILIAAVLAWPAGGCDAESGEGGSYFGLGSVDDGAGHMHRFIVECGDLSGASATYTTTLGTPTDPVDHQHTLTLTGDELAKISGPEWESIYIDRTDGLHYHQWYLTVPIGQCGR